MTDARPATQPNFVILYVADPVASATFYSTLLARPPVESSPGFAMFALDSGVMLGLWKRGEVLPTVDNFGAGAELAFAVQDNAAVDALRAAWAGRGLPLLQAPVKMDFGYTFVAADPDGHRLRVFAPGA